MNKKGDIEIEKIIKWALGILILLVILFFIYTFLNTGNEESLFSQVITKIKELGNPKT